MRGGFSGGSKYEGPVTKEERRAWIVTVIVVLLIIITCIILCVKYG